ncbi:MAG: hypothetical protein JWM87_1035 [Candidatus Eremiobacteraeota bacterium]|nr:hypothetical protein [Candidatus Eremiobacteraeota bacterium]
MLVGFAFPGSLLEQIVIGAAGSILAAIILDVILRLRTRVSGWTPQRIRVVSTAAGLVVALVVAVGIGYNWRASQRSGQDTSSPLTAASEVVVPASSPASSEPAATPSPPASEAAAATPSAGATASSSAGATAEPIATIAPPTTVRVYYDLSHGAWVAAVRAYIAHEPELLNDRNVVLSYVDLAFFATANGQCHNGQVSEFDEHRSYDAWVRRIKADVVHWRDDVPLTFDTSLGTYDFQHHELPLRLNPQGLVVYANADGQHCSFVNAVQNPFAGTAWYQITPGTVPQALAVTSARGEQILNLTGGRNVTVALHGRIESLDPHYTANGYSGYGIVYQPSEVTVRSGMVTIYHALVHGSK